MFRPTSHEMISIGLLVEGLFCGLYSGIFAMYLQCHATKKGTNKTRNAIFYSICILYVLSVSLLVSDISASIIIFLDKPMESRLRIDLIRSTSFGFCDFFAQFILIYRCWIVWGSNIRVVVIPSILAFVYLATWLASGDSQHMLSGQPVYPGWGQSGILSCLVLSLVVNALVTGLIVFRIFRVFRDVKATSDDKNLGGIGGSKLQRMIFILIESGMVLFSIQLARLVTTTVWTEAAQRAFSIIAPIHEMLNGITPTIILVRTSMGLSFDDEKSVQDFAIESLRFASNHLNSVPETGSIGVVGEDSRNDDSDIDHEIQSSSDIDIVLDR